MKNDNTEQLVTNWHKKLQTPLKLELIVNNNKKSELFQSFFNDFSKLASKVTITTRKDGNAAEPFIQINDNLVFKAIPEDKLLKSFLDILSFNEKNVSQKTIENLNNFNIPVTLNVYISPFCPFCPKVVSDISQLAFTGKKIKVVIIDGALFPTLAEKDKIVSAPTIVYNETFRWTGAVKPEDIAEVIGNTKPEELSLEALTTIIETGKASILAGLMLNAKLIFPAFYDLLTHEKWPLRLGAMVAMEEIAGEDPALAEDAVTRLWKNFSNYDDSVKGDIIYITGEVGNPADIDKIESIINGNYSEELKEAAFDAVESLKG